MTFQTDLHLGSIRKICPSLMVLSAYSIFVEKSSLVRRETGPTGKYTLFTTSKRISTTPEAYTIYTISVRASEKISALVRPTQKMSRRRKTFMRSSNWRSGKYLKGGFFLSADSTILLHRNTFLTKSSNTSFCVIRNYLSTMRKQGRSILASMATVFDGSPFPIAWEPGT